MTKLVDRLISRVDKIREKVNQNMVGVRRFRLYKVVETWSGGEVGDGTPTRVTTEITPAPAIALGKTRDAMNGRGRVEVGSMTATEISLRYTEADLQPTLSAGQRLYYKLVELNSGQAQETTFWILEKNPEPDRCETVDGNIQWILSFTQAAITE